MQAIEHHTSKGFVEYHLYDERGALKDHRVVPNVITNVGLAEMASLILLDNPDSATAFDFIAIGTGTTAAAASQTALVTEITTGGGGRTAGTGTTVTTSVTDDTSQLTATFSFTGTFAITESGVFNAASAGIMLCRQVFAVINVVSGDSLVVTWKIQHT